MLSLMKVNLLQGTCTPTLTPMPGVHKPLQATAKSMPRLSGTTFSLRFAQGERGAERLVPALRSAPGEPGTRDGSPFGGPLSAALGGKDALGLRSPSQRKKEFSHGDTL